MFASTGTRRQWVIVCVVLAAAYAPIGRCDTAWILVDGQPDASDGISAESFAQALGAPGREVSLVTARDLDRGLDAAFVDVLIVPGPGYPASIREPLLAYLRDRGGLLSIGGRPFSVPTFEDRGAWRPIAEAPDDGSVVAPLDGWSVNQDPGPPEVSLNVVADGVLELSVPDKSAWHYAKHALEDTLGPDHRQLSFRAKGDGSYRRLCLELNEADGSRWKAWVPVTDRWQRYVVHTGEFLSYATEERGGPDDAFHVEAASAISIGGYRSLWGEGEHRLSIADVAFLRCPVPGARVHVLSPPEPLMRGLAINDSAGALPVWVEYDSVPARRMTIRAPAGDEASINLRGARGWPVHAVCDAHLFPGVPDEQTCARAIPLIRGASGEGVDPVTLGLAIVSFAGPFAGSRCAFIAVEEPSRLLATEDGVASLRETVDYLCSSGPLIADVRIDSRPSDGGGMRIVPTAWVINPSDAPVTVEVRGRVTSLARGAEARAAAAEVRVDPGKPQDIPVYIDLGDDGVPPAYRVDVHMLAAGRVSDQLSLRVEPRKVLREAWDWLVSIQQADGTFSSMYFVDAYAARALAGASRSGAKGARRYLDAALRWADGMVERQRDDGGYWVGYGPPGQEVYVADDGSIALGLACLHADAGPKRRARYLASLRKYMAFRESFRNEDGSIGIGYTKTDYFTKPIGRFDEVTREMRGYVWTIGCSLGAAAALYAITGEPADRERAIRDTRYLMANAGKTGLGHGYYAEAAMLAHLWVDDEELRGEIEGAIPEHFAASLYNPSRRFWSISEGRSCLSLMALEWWRGAGGATEETQAQAAVFRALARLCERDSPEGIARAIEEQGRLTILIGFALCGVQETLGGLDTYPRQMTRED